MLAAGAFGSVSAVSGAAGLGLATVGGGISGGGIAAGLAAHAVKKAVIWKILTGVGVGLGGTALIGLTIITGGAAEEIDGFEDGHLENGLHNAETADLLGINATDNILQDN